MQDEVQLHTSKSRTILIAILPFESLLVMWHNNGFNTWQLYALPTLYLCVLYLPENKQRLVPLTA